MSLKEMQLCRFFCKIALLYSSRQSTLNTQGLRKRTSYSTSHLALVALLEARRTHNSVHNVPVWCNSTVVVTTLDRDYLIS